MIRLVCNYSTAVRPQIESIEVFVLGKIVCVRKTVELVPVDGPRDLRAVHLAFISIVSSRGFLKTHNREAETVKFARALC